MPGSVSTQKGAGVLDKKPDRETKKPNTPTAKKYHLSTLMILSMILAGVMALFVSSTFIITCGSLPMVISFAAIDTFVIAFIIWRIITPLVEISETGLKVNIPFLFKRNAAKWDEIESMTVGEQRTFGFKERNVRICLKAEGAATKEISLGLKAVDKADEIIKRLREKIPEKRYEDLKQRKVLQRPVSKREIRYKGLTINESGIKRKEEIISWDKVKEIKYQGRLKGGQATLFV